MSKLPISALANQYPRGVAAAAVQGSTMNQLFNSMAQNQSTSGPHGSSHSTVVDNSISFCVQGVFMWLLLVWITAGTAAIVVLMVKNCRTRWTFFFQKKSKFRATFSRHPKDSGGSESATLILTGADWSGFSRADHRPPDRLLLFPDPSSFRLCQFRLHRLRLCRRNSTRCTALLTTQQVNFA